MLTIASTAQNNAEHALRQQQSNKDLKGRNNIVIFEWYNHNYIEYLKESMGKLLE